MTPCEQETRRRGPHTDDDDTTWWAARRESKPSLKPRSARAWRLSRPHKLQHAYDALTPMVELDRQRRAEATRGSREGIPSVTEVAQRAGNTPTEAARCSTRMTRSLRWSSLIASGAPKPPRRLDGHARRSVGRLGVETRHRSIRGPFARRTRSGLHDSDYCNSPNPPTWMRAYADAARSDDVDDDEARTITPDLRLRYFGLRVLRLGTFGFRFIGLGVLGLGVSDSGFWTCGFLGLRVRRSATTPASSPSNPAASRDHVTP